MAEEIPTLPNPLVFDLPVENIRNIRQRHCLIGKVTPK